MEDPTSSLRGWLRTPHPVTFARTQDEQLWSSSVLVGSMPHNQLRQCSLITRICKLWLPWVVAEFPGCGKPARFRWPRGLRRRPLSLGRWDHWFEFRLRHRCLLPYFCDVLTRVGRGLYDGLITRPRSLTKRLNKIKKPPVCDAAMVLTRTVQPRRRRWRLTYWPNIYTLLSSI
jgi:hypothetical protein